MGVGRIEKVEAGLRKAAPTFIIVGGTAGIAVLAAEALSSVLGFSGEQIAHAQSDSQIPPMMGPSDVCTTLEGVSINTDHLLMNSIAGGVTGKGVSPENLVPVLLSDGKTTVLVSTAAVKPEDNLPLIAMQLSPDVAKHGLTGVTDGLATGAVQLNISPEDLKRIEAVTGAFQDPNLQGDSLTNQQIQSWEGKNGSLSDSLEAVQSFYQNPENCSPIANNAGAINNMLDKVGLQADLNSAVVSLRGGGSPDSGVVLSGRGGPDGQGEGAGTSVRVVPDLGAAATAVAGAGITSTIILNKVKAVREAVDTAARFLHLKKADQGHQV